MSLENKIRQQCPCSLLDPSHSDMLCDHTLQQGLVYQPTEAPALAPVQSVRMGTIYLHRCESLRLTSKVLSPEYTLTVVLTLCVISTRLFHICLPPRCKSLEGEDHIRTPQWLAQGV